MATEFDDWLRALAATGKGGASLTLEDIPAAIRGEYWNWPVQLAGDWTTAAITGTIRAAPDAPTALATITFSAGTYDPNAGVTTWFGSLAAGTGANSTGSLPADVDGDGIIELPIAVYLTPSGGNRQLLLGGKFTLTGKV